MNLPNIALPKFAVPKLSLPKIAAVIVGVLAVSGGAFFGFRALSSRATNQDPKNVQIIGINENSASVNWTSGIEVLCTLEYGTSATALNFFGPESRASTTHSIKLTLLSPKTTYYFQIHCGDSKFTNAGVPWSFQTTDAGAAAILPIASPSATLAPTASTKPISLPTNPVVNPSTRPAPIQTLVVPTSAPQANSSCTETDCNAIKAKLGQGCSSQEWSYCMQHRITPTP